MPSGVEHWMVQHDTGPFHLIPSPMPSGVEHSTIAAYRARQAELIPPRMLSGVEHGLQIKTSSGLNP